MANDKILDQAGEISVVLTGTIDVVLGLASPKHITVEFKDDDDCEIIPCNPITFDEISYELHYKNNRYVLVLIWNVSDVRKVEWRVRY